MDESRDLVCVVDDDSSMRAMLLQLLASAGYQVEAYASGPAFLESDCINRCACIVLDLRMPGMTGLQMQQQLVSRGIDLPIVFVTAYGSVDAATRAMHAGAVYFLEKPVEPDELLARVRTAVENHHDKCRRERARSEIERRLSCLTARESVVLEHVLAGKTSRQIATELHNSPKTIELHRAHILQKMRARNVAQLVRMVTEHSESATS